MLSQPFETITGRKCSDFAQRIVEIHARIVIPSISEANDYVAYLKSSASSITWP